MLDTLRNFIRGLNGADKERHFGEDDQRLALAALLVHCTAIDGKVSAAEQAKLKDVLGRTFGIGGDDLQVLIADAIAAEQESVDLYRFTSVLKRQMSEDERIRAVELLWEVVYSDGASHEFEDNLIWRIAELLGVNRRDRIAKKLAVAENKSAEQGDAG